MRIIELVKLAVTLQISNGKDLRMASEIELETFRRTGTELSAAPEPPQLEITLGSNALFKTTKASIVSAVVKGLPPLVAKFEDNCLRESDKETDVPVAEYGFLSVLNSTGLSPKVYFISPLIPVGDLPEEALSQTVLDRKIDCIEKGAKARYILQERVGPTIADYIDWIHSSDKSLFMSNEFSRRLLTIYKKTLFLIERLHSLGIMHGDVHLGNIAFKKIVENMNEINLDEDELVLIDFGMALYFAPNIGKPSDYNPRSIRGLSPYLLSHWRLSKQREGPREDTHKLTQTVGNALSRATYKNGYDRLAKNLLIKMKIARGCPQARQAEQALSRKIKENEPLFKRSDILKSQMHFEEGSFDHSKPILGRLEAIHSHIKSCESPDITVDFSFIHSQIDFVLSVIV
jgi:serine/threonine protein kinase